MPAASHGASRRTTGCRTATLWSDATRPAFTLLELLVSIAVVAVLVSILLVALAGVRRQSRQLQSVTNLRSLGQTFSIYSSTYNALPFGFFGWARPPETGLFGFGFNIWAIDEMWPVLMHGVAPWPEHAPTWVSPGADPARFAVTWSQSGSTYTPSMVSYQYSLSFVGMPALWDGRTSANDSFVRPTRETDVLFPSAKVVALDTERAYLRTDDADREPRPVLLVDGSAQLRRDADAAPPTPNPISGRPPRVYHDTPMGVHGRDFR